LAIALCLAALAPMIRANPFENIQTDSWVYEAVDYLKTAGLIRTVPSSSRPWTREYAARLVSEAVDSSGAHEPKGIARYQLSRLSREFTAELSQLGIPDRPRGPIDRHRRHNPLLRIPADSTRTLNFDFFDRVRADTGNQSVSLGGGFSTTNRERFAAYNRVELVAFRETIPNVLDSSWYRHVPGTRVDRYKKNFLFDITEAYLRFRIPWMELDIGRSFLYWGPGHVSSVMLSDVAPSLDRIQVTADYRRFKYTAFTVALSGWRGRQRFLSAQRIEVNFLDRILFGTALFVVHPLSMDSSKSTDSTQTKDFWGYLNPFIPLYPEMANANHTDNLFAGADLVVHLPWVKLYGQAMIDNVDILNKAVSYPYQSPAALGLEAGLFATPISFLSLRYEYARVSNFTYYHRIPWLGYTNYDVPMGHELGPDADQHFAEIDCWPFNWGHLALQGSITRRGDRNRGDWTVKSWLPGVTLQDTLFPYGTVERTVSFGPQLTISPFSLLRLVGNVNLYAVENQAGTVGHSANGISFKARLEYRY
jgi:hypothetical protein